MVASRGPKIAFAVLVVFGFLFTLIGLFTPGWRHYENGGDEPNFGLVTYDCGSNNNQINQQDCKQWWQSRQPYEKAVISFIIFALLFEVVCVIWAVFSCCSFCCPHIYAPLPFLALLASLCLLVGFVVFAAKNPDDVQYLPSTSNQLNANNKPGYSFYLIVIAFAFMIIAALLGFYALSLHSAENGMIVQRPLTGTHHHRRHSHAPR